jgi:ribosomal peptide maturation radical SAM protein 1
MIRDSDMLFVVMPWASPQVPVLGASLLLSIIELKGFRGQVAYPGMELVQQTGWPFYAAMANDIACYELSEHFFSCYVHGKERMRSEEFLAELLRGGTSVADVLGSQPERCFEKVRDEIVPQFIETQAARIAERAIPIVGFSCGFNQVLASLALAKRIKELRSDVRILFGGASLDAEMGIAHHMKYGPIIDHVYLGEADTTIAEIVRRLTAGEPLDTSLGVTMQEDGHVIWGDTFRHTQDLDGLPAPNYDDFYVQRQKISSDGEVLPQVGALSFETSRGCRWAVGRACSFCGLNGARRDFRAKSPAAVLHDLEELSARYLTLDFLANDNVVEMKGFSDLLPGLEASGCDYSLAVQVRTNLTRSQVAALRRGGVRTIQAGIESFSDHVLGLMRKGATSLQNLQMLKWCREYGISVNYFILCGFPGELEEDYAQMADLAPMLVHLQPPARIQHIDLHRFSPMFTEPSEFGIEEVFMREGIRYVYPDEVLTGELPYSFRFYSSKCLSVGTQARLLEAALRDWTILFNREDAAPVLEMRMGKDFLLIRDTRSDPGTAHYVEGLERSVILLADAVIQRRRLHAAIEERLPTVDASAIDEAIVSLEKKGLLLVDKERLLALPVRESRQVR